jgi:small subunit ribosomal protein S6
LSAATASEYELVLMLDPEAPDERRDQIAAEARRRIESAGTLKHDTAWGMRKLAYEIRQRTEADYRFFRFENGGALLDDLSHNLRIADGVLRFRIFKVDSRSPLIVPPAPSGAAAAPSRGPRRAPTPPAAEETPPEEVAAEESSEQRPEGQGTPPEPQEAAEPPPDAPEPEASS